MKYPEIAYTQDFPCDDSNHDLDTQKGGQWK